MKMRPLNMDKFSKKYKMKEVYNFAIDGPGTLFDPNIFGKGEDKKILHGYIDLKGHFIDPTTYMFVSRRVFRDLPFIVSKEKKFSIDSKGLLVQDPDGNTGIEWLYKNFDKIKFKNQKDAVVNKYTRDNFFINKMDVIPLHFRDVNTTSGTMKIDELNNLYMDLIKACKFKERNSSSSLDTSFIDVKVQGILVSIVEYISNMLFGKKGAQRQLAMGRSVDNSARIVLSANEVRMKDTLGKGKVTMDSSCYPLHHLLNMFPIHIITEVQKLLHYFYDLNLMDNLSLEEFEDHFTDDYIKEMIENYYHSYADRSSYVLGPHNEKFEFDFEFKSRKGTNKIHRGITWMELFYIAFNNIKDSVRAKFTRFPVTGKESLLFVKPHAIVMNTDEADCKIFHNNTEIFNLEDFCDITKYIEEPIPYVYEETEKISNLLLNGLGADFDGDKVISESIYSKDAVEEIDKYNETPLSFVRPNGDNLRTLGKEPVQAIYDLTLMKEKDLVNGSAKINSFINETFTPNKDFKLEEIIDIINTYSIYTKVSFKGKNTTLGRVIFNEVVFNHIPDYEFCNYDMTASKQRSIFNSYIQKRLLSEKMTSEDFKFALDKYNDLAFGICDIVASATTMRTLINDDPVFNKKKEELFKKYGIDKPDFNDPIAYGKFEEEMVAFSKEHYKDDPMANVYNSGASSSWAKDFKQLKIGLGAQPEPGGERVNIIKNSLKEGIKQSDVLASANTQIMGARARGVDTQDSGYRVKQMIALMQSVYIYEGDCGSKQYKEIIDNNPSDLLGRTILDKGKEVLVTEDNIDKYLGKPNKKRTPMFCKSKEGYCSACAGVLPLRIARSKKMNIGLFVSDIGSELSNKSMKKVHDMRQKVYTINDLDNYIKK